MSLSWFIAKRYLQSQRRSRFLSFISLFSIIGIMLGTAALIVTLTILDGFEHEIKSKVVEFTSHIQIMGFQNQPLKDPSASVKKVLDEVHNVKSMMPFAAKEGMIRSREGVDGIYLKGIDPANDIIAPRYHLVEGKFLDRDTTIRELVIGKKLALRLNANIGDKLVIFALPENGAKPKAMQFQLVGMYESGMAEFDDIYAYTSLVLAQQLFQFEGQVSGYDVLVNDLTQLDQTAEQLQETLGYPHFARTVFQTYHNLFSWVELQKKMSPILLSLIMIVAAINSIGTLLMFVLEKTHDIGILKSLGAGTPLIKRIFILQGFGICALGILLGNILAYGCCAIQAHFNIITLPSEIYYMSTVPMLLEPVNFLFVTVAAAFLCMIAVMIPARTISSLHPVQALRFG